jgi:hypothetical protein
MRSGRSCAALGRWFLVLGASAIVGLSAHAQTIDGFVLYQMTVHCDDASTPNAIFTHKVPTGGTAGRPLMGTYSFCVGRCEGKTVALADELAKLPGDVAAALQAQVDQREGQAACGKAKSLAACLSMPKPKYTTGSISFKVFPFENGAEVIPSQDKCPGCLWELVTVDFTYRNGSEGMPGDGAAPYDAFRVIPGDKAKPLKVWCDYRYYAVWRCPINSNVTTTVQTKRVEKQCPTTGIAW